MKKIGLITRWTPGDRGWTGMMYHRVFSPDNEVRVLAVGPDPATNDEWGEVPVSYHDTLTSGAVRSWIERYELDAVIMNQYKDWSVMRAARERCPILCHLDISQIKMHEINNYRIFSKVVSSSFVALGYLQKVGVDIVKIPLGISMNGWDRPAVPHKGLVMIHIVSEPGEREAKNTDAALRIFDGVSKRVKGMMLLILTLSPWEQFPAHWQKKVADNPSIHVKEGLLPRNKYITILKTCDLMLHPCRWSSNHVQIAEALVAGLPVLTCDAPPMNEHIQADKTGLLIPSSEKQRPSNALLASQEIDLDCACEALAGLAADREKLSTMKQAAADYGKETFALGKVAPDIRAAFDF
jgi:glycosyltransferase involved in cell wall biosynthesis